MAYSEICLIHILVDSEKIAVSHLAVHVLEDQIAEWTFSITQLNADMCFIRVYALDMYIYI